MSSCCDASNTTETQKQKKDYFFWCSAIAIIILYSLQITPYILNIDITWIATLSHSVYDIINTIWWGIVIGIIMVGILSYIPKEFIISILGDGKGINSIFRAVLGGILLDLCSHGILMVGMKIYHKGASLGQVMAFLIASPWNSFSLTFVLISLIGFAWTLLFILMSIVIAVITGMIFNYLVKNGTLPDNPNKIELDEDFHFFKEVMSRKKNIKFSFKLCENIMLEGFRDSKMVLRWVLFGVILAGVLRATISADQFQIYFGATMLGLGMTLITATIIEICSEGSVPIAADIFNRANSPGNSFAFLMTGVSTDYTEIMSIKGSTKSWKIALFLPLVTIPQIVVVALLINI